MPEILFHYERVNPSSWAYLSSLLMLVCVLQIQSSLERTKLRSFLIGHLGTRPAACAMGLGEHERGRECDNDRVLRIRLAFLGRRTIAASVFARPSDGEAAAA